MSLTTTITTTTTTLLLTNGASSSSLRPKSIRKHSHRQNLSPLSSFHLSHFKPLLLNQRHSGSVPFFSTYRAFRVRSFQPQEGNSDSSGDPAKEPDNVADKMIEDFKIETSSPWSSFLAKLALALGIAATVTLVSVGFKWPMQGSSSGVPFVIDGSATVPAAPSVSFNLKVFGYQLIVPQYAPGWVYFWLLMAAGCGLFVSEEALNIWVGISLARVLCLDGTWKSFAESFTRNAPYIMSTILWVYWGVCISDMVPFYVGRFFRQSGGSADVCSKLGIGKEKAISVTRAVQRYGNLIGFVERFSVGVRNPTSFLAGALGISADCFFAGVCCGGLITLPVQAGGDDVQLVDTAWVLTEDGGVLLVKSDLREAVSLIHKGVSVLDTVMIGFPVIFPWSSKKKMT